MSQSTHMSLRGSLVFSESGSQSSAIILLGFVRRVINRFSNGQTKLFGCYFAPLVSAAWGQHLTFGRKMFCSGLQPTQTPTIQTPQNVISGLIKPGLYPKGPLHSEQDPHNRKIQDLFKNMVR